MASKNITFSDIPASIRKPGKYFEFNTRLAVRTLPANKQRLLIIGQRTSAGTIVAKIPTLVFSDAEAATYFGIGSMCHLMARAAITANPYLDLTVIALDDAVAGVAATGTITIAGAATTTGVLTVYVGSHKIEIRIDATTAAASIAAALKAELDNHPDLPVTASVAAAVVTLTARNKGLCGNDIKVSAILTNVAGVTATATAMANGATNPAIADALAVVFGEQYDIIATPYNTQADLTSLRTHLDAVSGPLEQRPGTGVYAMTGALAAVTTLSVQINSGRILCIYHRYTAATTVQSISFEIAASFA
ncbi:MAG: phage tail protein, partial [Syntrophorhabdus sp.]